MAGVTVGAALLWEANVPVSGLTKLPLSKLETLELLKFGWP